MRNYATGDLKVFSGVSPSARVRVSVKDAGGTFRDLTALYGWDFVTGVQIKRSVDNSGSQIASCSLNLKREIYQLALSTEVAGSRLNALGGGPRLLELNRDVKVEAQLVTGGDAANGSNWNQIFYGRIDKTNSGSDPMTVDCSDLLVRLQQAWVKTDLRYGIWDANRRLLSGTVVLKSDDDPTTPAYGYWQAQSTFTTGATEPAWPASPTPGVTTIADNGGTWLCVALPGSGTPGPRGTPLQTQIQQLLDDNLGAGAWTLYCPVSPSFEMNPYDQQKEPLLVAIQKCADLVGWCLEYRWTDSPPNSTPPQNAWAAPPGGVAGWYLTIYDPMRTNTTSSLTLDPGVYDPIVDFGRDISGIRNDIEVSYLDQSTLDANGNPTRKSRFATDAGSQASYGDAYMGIAEGTSGGIYTQAQADALGAAVVSDLAQPPVQTAVRTPLWWAAQLNDVVTLGADALHADSALTLAVFSLTLTFAQGQRPTTEWGLRQKPSSGHMKWHDRAAVPGRNDGPLRTLPPRKVVGASALATIGGGAISFQVPTRRQVPRYSQTQLHMSMTNGFTPSKSTLVTSGKTGRFDLAAGSLTPGTTYYYQLLHVDERGNVLAAGTQQSFTTGYTNLAHINPNITQNFEVRITGSSLSTSGWFKWDTVDYDNVGILDSVNWNWTFTYNGKVTVSALAVIVNAKAGDSARLKLQKWNTVTLAWDDWSIGKTYPVVTQALAGTPPTFTDVLEVPFSDTLPVSAGDKFRMAWDLYAATIPSPAWLVEAGGSTNFSASYIKCQQELG